MTHSIDLTGHIVAERAVRQELAARLATSPMSQLVKTVTEELAVDLAGRIQVVGRKVQYLIEYEEPT